MFEENVRELDEQFQKSSVGFEKLRKEWGIAGMPDNPLKLIQQIERDLTSAVTSESLQEELQQEVESQHYAVRQDEQSFQQKPPLLRDLSCLSQQFQLYLEVLEKLTELSPGVLPQSFLQVNLTILFSSILSSNSHSFLSSPLFDICRQIMISSEERINLSERKQNFEQ